MVDTTSDRVGPGLEAESMLSRLRPHFASMRQKELNNMVALFRQGSASEHLLLGIAAMLTAIDMLEKELEQRIRLGHKDLEASQRS